MTDRQEAIVRLVHALGRASAGDLLSAYQAGPLSASVLRNLLDDLGARGWIERVRSRDGRRANGVAWAITEEAVPHLLCADRLPRRPDHVPPRTPANAAPYVGRKALPRDHRHLHADYVPPPPAPMRPGALDFLKYPSHGACR